MSDQTSPQKTPPRKRRLWRWFVVGFGIIFLAMAFVWPMHFYDGQAVWQTLLWQYYLLEIRLAFTSSGNLGPTSGNASAALGVFATHIVIASVGGIVSVGIGWATTKKTSTR